jgi:hypothetical protein
MNNGRKDMYEKRDSMMAWCLRLDGDSLRNPLICEFNRRLIKIDNLLADNRIAGNLNQNPDILTVNEMMVTSLLNRCEAIQNQVTRGLNPPDLKSVERILYPSLYIACLQNVIRLIMHLKKRLKLNYNDYTATNIWQLMYLKYPAGLTKFFARVMARIRTG